MNEIMVAVSNLDKSLFTAKGVGKGEFDVSQVTDPDLFAMYAATCVIYGPCGFHKKIHNNKCIRDSCTCTHFGFQQACFELKPVIEAASGQKAIWPDVKDNDFDPRKKERK